MRIKLLLASLLALPVFALASCNNDNDGMSETNSDSSNTQSEIQESTEKMKKYTVTLDLNNYVDYIDLKFTFTTYLYYYFEGSLSYAYYENVSIKTEDGCYELSTGGFYGYIYKTRPTVTSVSGTVTYWM